MISLTVFETDAAGFNSKMHNFICNSFAIRGDGKLVVYFENGSITIEQEAYSDIIGYPHNLVDTDIFNPSLL